MKAPETLMIRGICPEEYLQTVVVEDDGDWGIIEMAPFMAMGHDWPFRGKAWLRVVWAALKGRPWLDWIMLDMDGAKKLRDWLSKSIEYHEAKRKLRTEARGGF